MSIPKEPRQLMINIMYLVLTALLALNVSAEIFNAFEMVDEGLKTANSSLDASNEKLPKLIKDGALKKESLQTYADRVDGVRDLSEEASTYIDEIVAKLVDEAGDRNGTMDEGDYLQIKDKTELVGKKNFDATTRLMVDEGLGDELKAKILEYRDRFIEFIDSADVDRYVQNIPIEIDEESWKNSPNNKQGWSDFTFGHMPLGATMPIFSKFKNDIKSSESAVLNYLANKVGTNVDVVLEEFTVVSAPKKSYVIKGEQFETDVFLSASAGRDSKTDIAISVNGRSLNPDESGVAKFTAPAASVGIKKYNAAITVTNPVTGEQQTFKREFEYEVGERSVAISATKMNVFYMGVPNPVEVSAAGVPSNQIQVSMSGPGGGTIARNSDGTYTVSDLKRPTARGEANSINVVAPGMNASKEFRVKRIPDPVAKLSNSRGGAMSAGEFKVQQGVRPDLENFDFDAKCDITEFVVVRVPKRQDPVPARNRGGRYQAEAAGVINQAIPGDKFFFENIKCKCPGDPAARNIGQMVFNIR